MKITAKHLIIGILGTLLVYFALPNPEVSKEITSQTSPNVLLIIADDMGLDASPWYSDFGKEKPVTPNLDALAANGMVLRSRAK